MKFMIEWKIAPGCYKSAVERFLATGAPGPPGVKSLGRWHAPGSATGWHVVEADAATIAEHEARWGDLLEVRITPVLEDAEAAGILARMQKK